MSDMDLIADARAAMDYRDDTGWFWVGRLADALEAATSELTEAIRLTVEYTRVKQAEAWERGHAAFEQAWESDNRFPYDYATDNPYRKVENDE